jgi:hypothetical protein
MRAPESLFCGQDQRSSGSCGGAANFLALADEVIE